MTLLPCLCTDCPRLIQDLNGKLNAAVDRISALEAWKAAAERRMGDAEGRITGTELRLTNAESRMGQAEARVSYLESNFPPIVWDDLTRRVQGVETEAARLSQCVRAALHKLFNAPQV